MEAKADYLIYPSLLDKFQRLLDYEEVAEEPWNRWTAKGIANMRQKWEARRSRGEDPGELEDIEEGDYIFTPDEMAEMLEEELLNAVNRVPSDPSEAAARGTALNEIVDCMVTGQRSTRDDITIQALRAKGDAVAIRADYEGFTFDFSPDLCRHLRDELRGSLCQTRLEAPIDVDGKMVWLYGYADYWLGDVIIDLKTTKQYTFGKYVRGWQKDVYPYCAIASGLTTGVSEFTYLAVQLSGHKLLDAARDKTTGDYTGIYAERYDYNHDRSRNNLRNILRLFIEWLERNREKITDKKIFNNG